MSNPAAEQTVGFTVHAAGEVRDAQGNLVETVASVPAGTQVEVLGVTYTADADGNVQIPAAALSSFTDDQLRAVGLDEPSIALIRSTP
jgi:hypothetical protein